VGNHTSCDIGYGDDAEVLIRVSRGNIHGTYGQPLVLGTSSAVRTAVFISLDEFMVILFKLEAAEYLCDTRSAPR
jgi:hypothetical protein